MSEETKKVTETGQNEEAVSSEQMDLPGLERELQDALGEVGTEPGDVIPPKTEAKADEKVEAKPDVKAEVKTEDAGPKQVDLSKLSQKLVEVARREGWTDEDLSHFTDDEQL